MADEKLEQLKLKYQSVINLMKTTGVQVKNLHVQENKLVIRGEAKTKNDANKIWNQIKLVDKDYKQDLMVEIPIWPTLRSNPRRLQRRLPPAGPRCTRSWPERASRRSPRSTTAAPRST